MEVDWRSLARARSFALVTDLDGSLVPFADDPAHARPSQHVVTVLSSLAALDRTMVVVASGRPKADLELYFGAWEAIDLFAEHGLWVREGGTWKMTDDVSPEPLVELAIELDVVCAAYPGAHVERKTRGVGVHYRKVPEADKHALLARVDATIERTLDAHRYLQRLAGHEVVEVRLAGVTKAKAVHLAKKRMGSHVPIVALGDDVTDEDMFRELSPGDLGIMIGHPSWQTAAAMHLDDPQAAIELVGQLYAIRAEALRGTPV